MAKEFTANEKLEQVKSECETFWGTMSKQEKAVYLREIKSLKS